MGCDDKIGEEEAGKAASPIWAVGRIIAEGLGELAGGAVIAALFLWWISSPNF